MGQRPKKPKKRHNFVLDNNGKAALLSNRIKKVGDIKGRIFLEVVVGGRDDGYCSKRN
jgi:hypothetical protein